MYEHPQNVLLVKLINANLDLLAVHKEAAAGASAGGLTHALCAALASGLAGGRRSVRSPGAQRVELRPGHGVGDMPLWR